MWPENVDDSINVSRRRGPAGEDYRLTRHACYLVAESADGRKPQVALAKIYFALTTERYELLATTEEERERIELRQKLLRHNAKLALQARATGVITPAQFACPHVNPGGCRRRSPARHRPRHVPVTLPRARALSAP